MSTTADILRTVPLFTGLTDATIDAIAALAYETEIGTGDHLARQGDPGDAFMVILDGSARVDQDGREIRRMGRGDFLGEISLIDGSPRTATITALEPIRALTIDREGFDKLMTDFPVVRLGLLNALTQRERDHTPGIVD
jgi:CRP/FNR family transcriptional regulator, cyclic AMP receptor protein